MNVSQAEQAFKDKQVIELTIINGGNKNMTNTHRYKLNETGMEIIYHLQKVFPPPPNTYLNLYKQQNYTQTITYGMLSEQLSKIKLQNK